MNKQGMGEYDYHRLDKWWNSPPQLYVSRTRNDLTTHFPAGPPAVGNRFARRQDERLHRVSQLITDSDRRKWLNTTQHQDNKYPYPRPASTSIGLGYIPASGFGVSNPLLQIGEQVALRALERQVSDLTSRCVRSEAEMQALKRTIDAMALAAANRAGATPTPGQGLTVKVLEAGISGGTAAGVSTLIGSWIVGQTITEKILAGIIGAATGAGVVFLFEVGVSLVARVGLRPDTGIDDPSAIAKPKNGIRMHATVDHVAVPPRHLLFARKDHVAPGLSSIHTPGSDLISIQTPSSSRSSIRKK